MPDHEPALPLSACPRIYPTWLLPEVPIVVALPPLPIDISYLSISPSILNGPSSLYPTIPPTSARLEDVPIAVILASESPSRTISEAFTVPPANTAPTKPPTKRLPPEYAENPYVPAAELYTVVSEICVAPDSALPNSAPSLVIADPVEYAYTSEFELLSASSLIYTLSTTEPPVAYPAITPALIPLLPEAELPKRKLRTTTVRFLTVPPASPMNRPPASLEEVSVLSASM